MKRRYPLLRTAFLAGSALLLAACNKQQPARNSKWIARVDVYAPAPGQFMNESLGDRQAALSIVGGRSGCASLGGFGGYIVFSFDHQVENRPGIDFVIHGNAFPTSSEPGVVSVSPDGTAWYELKGSAHGTAEQHSASSITYSRPASTVDAQPIPWTHSRLGAGELVVNPSHTQCYYPLWFSENSLSFSGTELEPRTAVVNHQHELYPYESGYADNFSADYNELVNDDPDTRGSNKFDLSNAVDASGRPVELARIRLVRVHTAVLHAAGPIGEVSTEVCGAISLTASR